MSSNYVGTYFYLIYLLYELLIFLEILLHVDREVVTHGVRFILFNTNKTKDLTISLGAVLTVLFFGYLLTKQLIVDISNLRLVIASIQFQA